MKNRYMDNKFGFIFFYPNDWIWEKEENIITVYNPKNGLGALQFSIYYVGNDREINLKVELEDFLEDYNSFKVEIIEGKAYSRIKDEDRIWYYWFFQSGNSLILATYNCEIKDEGKENELIKNILNSFTQSSIN